MKNKKTFPLVFLFEKMRRLTCVAVFAVFSALLSAQPSMDWQSYRIDYVKEAHLLRKGNQLTMVDLKLEWPVRLSGMPTTALQAFLSKTVFDNTVANLGPALASYLNQYGDEVKQMPDEEGLKVRHIHLNLQSLAWEKDKYISMRLVRMFRNSEQEKPDSVSNVLFTYDIVADKVLQTYDILSEKCFEDYLFGRSLAWNIVRGMSEEYAWNIMMNSAEDYVEEYLDNLPDEVCMMPVGLLFNVPWLIDEDGVNPISIVQVIDEYISKGARKTINGKSKPRKDNPINKSIAVSSDMAADLDDTLHVYETADSLPHYDGGTKKMSRFLQRQVSYPSYEQLLGIEGKVTVSFIVECDGSISSPSVISPVSPGIDRQAVAAIMAMPRWIPGKRQGVAVRTRVSVPVLFKLGTK